MVHWLWLIPAVASGLCSGFYITIYATIDTKLRADDARDTGV